MKASETPLITFLQGPKQYLIPIYQRTYNWSEKQCEQLWDDIVQVSQNDKIPSHFLGSVVYIQRGIYQASAVNSLMVIDGQQRLTTMTLLLAAIRKKLEESDAKNINRTKINNYFLFNNDEEGDNRQKLVLTKSDKETLFSLLDETPLPENPSKHIIDNYNYFLNQINKSEINLDLLYHGICKLVIVDISLDSNYDNPQLIFESLNSTGLELSQSDQIRNFVLMGLEVKLQEEIYNSFWYPMESNFGHSEGSEYFDSFMRDYLTVKLVQIPKEKEVYIKFKEYFSSQDKPIKEIVEDIYYYSKFYVSIAYEKHDDPDILKKITDINALRVDVAYPFLLEVMADFDKGKITQNDLLEILDIVESYVFRRQICEISSSSLNKTFATLYGLIQPDNYLESLKAAFLLKDAYRQFPNDGTFHERFMLRDVYNFRPGKYLLRKLENFGRKEPVKIDEYTIEHIMPQNEKVPSEWREELGENWREIHDKYLHRIGNITLTGYNSELSDSSFKEKQTMEGGFKDSPIRLNSELALLEHWNESTIKNRSKNIADKALQIWTYPTLPTEILQKYQRMEEEDDDEESDSLHGWENKRSLATERIRKIQDSLIKQISEKFDCHIEPYRWWMVFYTEKPTKGKNMFALLNCGKDTSRIMFRINPDTFSDDDKTRKVNGWFFPRGTERRMRVKEEDFPDILQRLEHAYNITKTLL